MHISILAVGLAVGQAVATGWRLDAQQYSCPENTNNECSTEQNSGYNWGNLEPGDFSSYGSNKFSGFKCGNSFGKRDGITKRSFQDKCITAEIDKEPKIECDGKDKMTIDSYQVSSSWDTDIDAHHQMPDGSTCKQTHRCTQGGNTVYNTQCAGSTSVTFKPKRGESGKNEKGESCSIGIHSIDFKCTDNRPSSTQPTYSASTVSSASEYTSASETTSSVASSYETTSEVETISSYGSSTSEVPTTSSTEVSPETTTSSGLPAFSSYANVSSTVPPESLSSYVATTGSSPPKYESSPSSSTVVGPESSAPAYETSAVLPTNSSAPAYSATTTSDVQVPTQTYETPNTPDLLPQCVNTWIGTTECKDNADASCYCRNAEMIKKVMGCLEAWSDDDEQTRAAAGYLQGICAQYVPENPAIITACPSAGKPPTSPVSETSASEKPQETAPTYETSSTQGSPITTAPSQMTTSTIYSTTVSTITSCAADVEDCPAASQSTAIVTKSVAISTTVCPISEAQSTESNTEGSPVTSSQPPAESPEKPTTLTYYSTSSVTITSCGAEVTDCPASSTIVSEVPVSYTVVETAPSSSAASPEQGTSTNAPTSQAPAPYTSQAPAATSPPCPSTTVSYSSSVQVPATYTTGESLGQEIPGSSTYVTIDTTITVPQVQFVTSTITAPGSTGTVSIGLAAGSPPAASAYPTSTADAAGGVAKPTGSSGFGTSYVPPPTGSPITPYTGSATIARTSIAGMAVGIVAAFLLM